MPVGVDQRKHPSQEAVVVVMAFVVLGPGPVSVVEKEKKKEEAVQMC